MNHDDPAPGPGDYEGPLEAQVIEIVAGAIGADPGVGGLGALVDAATRFMDDLTRDMAERHPPPRPIACREGCAFCCIGTEVHVSAPEVLRIRDYLTRHLGAGEAEALKARLRESADRKAALGPGDGPPPLPCPLLDDSRCRVYPVRPLVCRGFNSYDAGVCERRKVGGEDVEITGYALQDGTAQATLRGIQRGCAERGLMGDALDLAPALAIAMETPDAAERWRAGEDVFGPARARVAREPLGGSD